MKNYLIAERYANGLGAVIEDDRALEPALAALNDLVAAYQSDHDLRLVLGNPTVTLKVRRAILDELLEKLSPPAEIAGLAHVLLNRGRIELLADVAEVFTALVDRRLNRIEAKVVSASPLTSDQERQIAAALESFSGKTVRTACAVDKEVLGGVVARIGSTVIDGSLRARLAQLKETLLSEET